MSKKQPTLETHVLYWNDPDPIKGNDYRITYLHIMGDMALIQYNEGGSEAEVNLWEISVEKAAP